MLSKILLDVLDQVCAVTVRIGFLGLFTQQIKPHYAAIEHGEKAFQGCADKIQHGIGCARLVLHSNERLVISQRLADMHACFDHVQKGGALRFLQKNGGFFKDAHCRGGANKADDTKLDLFGVPLVDRALSRRSVKHHTGGEGKAVFLCGVGSASFQYQKDL